MVSKKQKINKLATKRATQRAKRQEMKREIKREIEVCPSAPPSHLLSTTPLLHLQVAMAPPDEPVDRRKLRPVGKEKKPVSLSLLPPLLHLPMPFKKLGPEYNVPAIPARTPLLQSRPSRTASHESHVKTAEVKGKHKIEQALAHCPVYKIDQTLEELLKETHKDHVLNQLEGEANGSLQRTPILPFSAEYQDANGKRIAVYLGSRLEVSQLCFALASCLPCCL